MQIIQSFANHFNLIFNKYPIVVKKSRITNPTPYCNPNLGVVVVYMGWYDLTTILHELIHCYIKDQGIIEHHSKDASHIFKNYKNKNRICDLDEPGYLTHSREFHEISVRCGFVKNGYYVSTGGEYFWEESQDLRRRIEEFKKLHKL